MYSLNELSQKLKGIPYLVLRNWDRLPNSLGEVGHEDLDLFTPNETKAQLYEALQGFDQLGMVDIWCPKDDYFPGGINNALRIEAVFGKRVFNGFKIPSEILHYTSLKYHSLVHKKDNPYKEVLDKLFLKIYQPVRCKDLGVGYYV